MKKYLALLLSAILLLSVVPTVAFARTEYENTYETALNLAKNDLTNLDSLNDVVTMLDQLGAYSFSRRYLSYFRQLLLLQGEDPDLAAAARMLDLCGKDASFTADLAERGLPSCSDLLSYVDARKQEKAGNLWEAIELYGGMSFLDSFDRVTDVLTTLASAPVKPSAKVGESVTFGSYEQDNDTANGKEPIEWLVLDVQGNHALLISRYALDCRKYNEENTSVTWEFCSLREWLNSDFLNTAFSEKEQTYIPVVTVSADRNPEYSTDPGNSTQEKIFLLSITEADRYFAGDAARRCVPADYAISQGGGISITKSVKGKSTCLWWLRSPGNYSNCAACIDYDGSVYACGRANLGVGAVRPALWVNLAS